MTMRKFAPTLRYEALLLAEMTGTLESFRTVEADVLLLGGSNGLPFLKSSLNALEKILPHARRHPSSAASSPSRDHPRSPERPTSSWRPGPLARVSTS